MGYHGPGWAVKGIVWEILAVLRFDFVFTMELPGRHRFDPQLVVKLCVSCFVLCLERRVRRPVSRVLSPLRRSCFVALDGHSSGTYVAARLARPTRVTGRERPCVAPVTEFAGHPYSVLLPVGFTLPPLSPGARCALTAPFHPCLRTRAGGLFSVALSLGSPPPAVSRHRFPVEPGLSSTPRTRREAAAVQPPDPAGCARRGRLRQGGGVRHQAVSPSSGWGASSMSWYSSSSGTSIPASGKCSTDPAP